MFAGFQNNAFQGSGFQILLGAGSTPVVAGGHFADYKQYQKRLRRMLKAAEARDEARYRKESDALVRVVTDLEKDIQPVGVAPSAKTQPIDIDFNSAITELNRLLLRVERAMGRQQTALADKRKEEELIFLLALQ